MAGGDPGFWHGPWPYLPGCAGEDHCRRQVPLYVLSHHHCAFTNIEAVAAGIYAALKASPMRLWTSHTLLLRCWSPSFRGVMSFVAQRPVTESNRPPSYQASTNEPESNRHFLCWWPEVIPAFWSLRPKPFTSTVKALRIATAHSPTRKRAIHAACLWVRPGFGVATHAPVQ